MRQGFCTSGWFGPSVKPMFTARSNGAAMAADAAEPCLDGLDLALGGSAGFGGGLLHSSGLCGSHQRPQQRCFGASEPAGSTRRCCGPGLVDLQNETSRSPSSTPPHRPRCSRPAGPRSGYSPKAITKGSMPRCWRQRRWQRRPVDERLPLHPAAESPLASAAFSFERVAGGVEDPPQTMPRRSAMASRSEKLQCQAEQTDRCVGDLCQPADAKARAVVEAQVDRNPRARRTHRGFQRKNAPKAARARNRHGFQRRHGHSASCHLQFESGRRRCRGRCTMSHHQQGIVDGPACGAWGATMLERADLAPQARRERALDGDQCRIKVWSAHRGGQGPRRAIDCWETAGSAAGAADGRSATHPPPRLSAAPAPQRRLAPMQQAAPGQVQVVPQVQGRCAPG